MTNYLCQGHTSQNNGDVKIGYDETTTLQGSTVVPNQLKLGIPVYFRGGKYEVGVFLRFKVEAGAVHFTLKVDRPDIVEDGAFQDVKKAVEDLASMPVHIGKVA